MKSIRILLITSLVPLIFPAGVYAATATQGHGDHNEHAAQLTKAQIKFLANYEGIRAALAADDLDAAKRSAANITNSQPATQMTKAASLNAARVAFKKLSADAIQLVKGQDGYHIANCPMAGSDWVQTTKRISNPYFGWEMATCGSIKN